MKNLMFYDIGLVTRKLVYRKDTNHSAWLQRQARVLKFKAGNHKGAYQTE